MTADATFQPMVPADPTRVDADDLIALRALALPLAPARVRLARSALAGAHRSRFRGRGMDYRESRHYQAGDDIRNMDWRITARAGHPHVKLFDEERERPVVVVAYFGPSMFFASRGVFKSVMAARLSALIGWSAIAHHDRIGALLWNGGHQELAPAGGRRGQMRLIRALVAAGNPPGSASGGLVTGTPPSGLAEALARLRRVARPGSLVFLISDFYGVDAEAGRHLARLARHSDLTAISVLDPLELAPPPPGRYGISDGRARGVIDTGRRGGRERWAQVCTERQAALAIVTADSGVPLVQCRTDDDPAERLAAAVAARGRVMRVGSGTEAA